MTITRIQIDRMRAAGRLHIDDDLAEMVIAQYGSEPEPYEYSEQDLHEQVRKMIERYSAGHELNRTTGRDSKPCERTPSMASLSTTRKGVAE